MASSWRDHPDAARIAHLLRRATFGPLPGQVERFLDDGYDALLERLIDSEPPPMPAPEIHDGSDDEVFWDLVPRTWTRWFTDLEPNLHAKTTWFWHGHLTSSLDKVDVTLLWWQIDLLRRHALGSFADMVAEITVDGAMLEYLDGDGSAVPSPNENYSRELMELFTLGHDGGYTEDDVRAGAKALAGWWVDWERVQAKVDDGDIAEPVPARFDPDIAHGGSVRFLGHDVRSAEDVAHAAVAHPSCAPFVVGRLFRFFVGSEPSDDQRRRLAATFVASGHQIRPVVADILTSREFEASEYGRPRYPVEWLTAAQAAAGIAPEDYDTWSLTLLGQSPGLPPNVAGWPSGALWLSASQALIRSTIATSFDTWQMTLPGEPLGAVLDRCSLVTVSDATIGAMRSALDDLRAEGDDSSVVPTLLAIALSSPEFALA